MAAPYEKRGLERDYWKWTLCTVAGLLVLLSAEALLFWLSPAEDFAAIGDEFRGWLIVFLLVATVSVLIAVAVVLRLFFQRYVLPLYLLGEDLEALLHGARGARLSLEEQEHLGRLETVLNELLSRHEVNEEDIERRLDSALDAVSKEKQGLESILEALREGVVVCGLDGLVLRYNSAARRLLDSGNYLGRQRSIYKLVEQPLCDYALDVIRSQIANEDEHPFAHFMVERPGAESLRVRVAPLQGEGTPLLGFVLSFEDPAASAPPVSIEQVTAAGSATSTSAPSSTTPSSTPAGNSDKSGAPLASLRYVVFDTETTGLEPSQGDEIISIGAVAIVEGQILLHESIEQLVDPRRPLSPGSIKVHGITPEMLAGKPQIGEALTAFSRFAEDSVLVAHNAAFDMRFIKDKEQATGLRFDHPVLDTLLLSAVLHPHQTSHSLDTLMGRYGIEDAGRHTALGDALMTAELFLNLLAQLEKRGMTLLGQVMEASRKTPLARITF